MPTLHDTEHFEIGSIPSALAIGHGIAVDLIAVLVAVTAGEPRVLTIQDDRALPSGPFELKHRSLQSGLRAWVERQTKHPLGYVEQLYTFADKDRVGTGQRVISISYLGLTREQPLAPEQEARWLGWYAFFPWEDHRAGVPAMLDATLLPRLEAWAGDARDPAVRQARTQRAAITFGLDGRPWNEELVLQRYELLYEARLIPEALRGNAATIRHDSVTDGMTAPDRAMILDHRRILATGIARLRAKIKYHPVVFELMPETFTLLQLQRCVEALAGRLVHKQNFRRLIESQELVEETGATAQDTGGRPAKLFTFRREILAERAIAGTKLPISRA
jgi:hypothetical protein